MKRPRSKRTRMICWKLKGLMERIRISNRELAQKLGKHDTSVSRMKNAEKMPRMGEDELDALCDALNDLYEERGFEASITPNDLLGYTRTPPSSPPEGEGLLPPTESLQLAQNSNKKPYGDTSSNVIEVIFPRHSA